MICSPNLCEHNKIVHKIQYTMHKMQSKQQSQGEKRKKIVDATDTDTDADANANADAKNCMMIFRFSF